MLKLLRLNNEGLPCCRNQVYCAEKYKKVNNMSSSKQVTIRRRGIYVLPNLFTLASLFAAFYGIVAAMEQHFLFAVWAIFASLILDGLDGRVARLINAQSTFGAELDSICDMVAFGVVPALVVLMWALPILHWYHLQKFGWIIAFIYVACVALRLARFNTPMTASKSKLAKRYFFGLPCPAAAAMVASLIWLAQMYQLRGSLWVAMIAMLLLLGVAILMVSNIKYRTFKDIDMRASVRFTVLLVMLLILVLIATKPAYSLFILSIIYIVSGPLIWLFSLNHQPVKGLKK